MKQINVITVSRQFGSGGRTIARRVADKLGWAYYDKEIIQEVARKSGFDENYIKEHSEYAPSRSPFAYSFMGPYIGGMSVDDYLWCEQRKIILEAVEKGPCVIVGRCSDYILRDRDDCLNVFVQAPLEQRAKRVLDLYGKLPDVKPEKQVRDKDKKRAVNYQYYTDQEWGKAENYHVCLDTGKLGLSRSVGLIVHLVRHPEEDDDFMTHE